jgi:ribosomal protein S18 acetylase RimI-like enzyme
VPSDPPPLPETPETPETPGLSWRPATREDVPAWARLLDAMAAVDDPAERATAEDLADEFEGSWAAPERNSLVGVDAAGDLRAFGWVERRPGELRALRVFLQGGVHPEWRGRGVGRALLGWQEARAWQLVDAAASELPVRVILHVEEHNVGHSRLAEAAGFQPVRYFSDMRRPLSVPVPDRGLPAGLRLVPFDGSLDEAVRLAHNETFADHWGSEPRLPEDWRLWTTGHRNFRADWSFVVLDGEQVAGYVLNAAYPQDWGPQGYTEGWTSLVGVRRAWRGRGLAPVLLTASMRAFRDAGMEYAGLGVDTENPTGALALYERLGYEPGRRSVSYAKLR